MFKRILLSVAAAAVVAGCASNVKLDDVPVVDRSATSVSALPPAGTGTAPPATSQSSVAPVRADTSGTLGPGPANVGRIVYFDYDSYVVKPEFQPVIEAHSRFLKSSNGRKIFIEGHTDERGGREYNLALGQRRAEAVRRSLGLLGVADNQVEAVSFGKEKPADPGMDESAFAKNRRAEIAYR